MTIYTVLESKSFYVTTSFLKGIIIAFHKVDHCFFSSKLCLISFLQFLFITLSNKFFTIKVFYYLCPRHSISSFPNLNHKNIFRQFWSVTFCKNFFYIFLHGNFKFRIFIIVFYIKVNIYA